MKYWLKVAEDRSSGVEISRTLKGWSPNPAISASSDAKRGDRVLLWRAGRGGGIVALGEVTDVRPVSDESVKVSIGLGILSFSVPITIVELESAGFSALAALMRMRKKHRELLALDLTEEHWQGLADLFEMDRPSEDIPLSWGVRPGVVVRRVEVNDVYGGGLNVRVGPSARTPNVFVFVKAEGVAEFEPSWDGSVLVVPGQAQAGRNLSSENAAVLAHQRRGFPLRVFFTRDGECVYLGEFAVDTDAPVRYWVRSGSRRRFNAFSRRMENENLHVPMLGLRQLNGILFDPKGENPFRGAPRARIRLRASGSRSGVDRSAATAVRDALAALERDPEAVDLVEELVASRALTTLLQRARRQKDLDALRALAEDPASGEIDLQKRVEQMTWIFGAEFLPGTTRRGLTARDQLDLALVRPDNSLHCVELKKANIRNLVTGYRNHLIVGPEVWKAVNQAMNYLREIDERRAQIMADFAVDGRRASATVVVGHSRFVGEQVTVQQVDETLRTANSYLSRVCITTYDNLIENAQRALDMRAAEEQGE